MKKKQNIFIKENFSSLLEIFVETKKIALFILLLIGSDVKSEWIQRDFLLLLNKKKTIKNYKRKWKRKILAHTHAIVTHLNLSRAKGFMFIDGLSVSIAITYKVNRAHIYSSLFTWFTSNLQFTAVNFECF
jgi:hypothetical protein